MFKRIKQAYRAFKNPDTFLETIGRLDLSKAEGVIKLLEYINKNSDESRMTGCWLVLRFIVRPNTDPAFRAKVCSSKVFTEIIETCGYLLESPKTEEK